MKMNENAFPVLSEDQIKHKMAGYKSAYQRRINQTKSNSEKKKLCDGMELWLKEKYDAIMAENKKAVQRRAGHLSWETRRMNEKSDEMHGVQKTGKLLKNVMPQSNERRNRYSSEINVSVRNRRSIKTK